MRTAPIAIAIGTRRSFAPLAPLATACRTGSGAASHTGPPAAAICSLPDWQAELGRLPDRRGLAGELTADRVRRAGGLLPRLVCLAGELAAHVLSGAGGLLPGLVCRALHAF